jgi:hypothetical protein
MVIVVTMGDDDMLIWSRLSKYAERSDQGHAVSASKGTDGWRYSAWAPEADPGVSSLKWYEARAQERYRRGEAVPRRSECLGIYPTADAARAACERQTAALAA